MTTPSKRSNQDSQPDLKAEPASKKAATGTGILIDEQQLLSKAQVALDRLESGTALDICTQIIESNSPSSNMTAALLMRSRALERLGRPYEAVKDVEQVLEGEKSRKNHLRATFAFLSMAIHHLELAQQFPSESEEQRESYVELQSQIRKSKDRELISFDRFSPEIFAHMSSYFEAPDLASAYAVNRSWRNSIFETTELFQHFKMEGGDVLRIVRGLKLFRERSKNSIKSIELRVTKESKEADRELLQETILASSQSIRNLTIFHQGDLCQLILNAAAECQHLEILSSRNFGERYRRPKEGSLSVLPRPFKPKLKEFEWDAGSDSLFCNDALINSLQNATRVIICSHGVSLEWVVELLSSNSNLVTLEMPYLGDEVAGEEIPLVAPLNLPHLESLWLDRCPCSRTGDSGFFFKNLHAPSLDSLQVDLIEPKGLLYLQSESHPKELSFEKFCGTQDEVSLFVNAIKGWTSLHTLMIGLDPSTFNKLIEILTPTALSDQVASPSLKSITLKVSTSDDESNSLVSGQALVAFVKARLNRSKGASGEEMSSTPENFEVKDQAGQTCAIIEGLDIEPPIQLKSEERLWLEKNVMSLHLKCKIVE